jgi:hypothetical protein
MFFRDSHVLSESIKIRLYKTIIFSVVLYACELWFATLRKEHRLRVFENRVLRRIFGPKRDEVTGSSGSIIRMIESKRIKWAGHVARMGGRGMHVGYLWEIQKERAH